MKYIHVLLFAFVLTACSSEPEWLDQAVGETNLSIQIPPDMKADDGSKSLSLGIEFHRFKAFNAAGTQVITIEVTRYPEPIDSSKIPILLNCEVLNKHTNQAELVSTSQVEVMGLETEMLNCRSEKLNIYLLSFLIENQHITIVAGNDHGATKIDMLRLLDSLRDESI